MVTARLIAMTPSTDEQRAAVEGIVANLGFDVRLAGRAYPTATLEVDAPEWNDTYWRVIKVQQATRDHILYRRG